MEIDIDSFELQIRITAINTKRRETVFVGNHFPKLERHQRIQTISSLRRYLCSYLIAAFANGDVDDFTHLSVYRANDVSFLDSLSLK